MSVKINTKRLVKKLEALKANLPLEIKKSLQKVGDKIMADIVTMREVQNMPRYAGGEPGDYFSRSNIGIRAALAEQKAMTNINEGIVGLLIGDWKELEAATPMEGENSGGKSYADLFLSHGEYERSKGTLAGGSTTHGYNPGVDRMTTKVGKKHPGVQPVYVFEDTLEANREDIINGINEAVRLAITKSMKR